MSTEDRELYCHAKYKLLKFSDPGRGDLEPCYAVCSVRTLDSFVHDCQLHCPEYAACLTSTLPLATALSPTDVSTSSHTVIYTAIIAVLAFLALVLVLFVGTLVCSKCKRRKQPTIVAQQADALSPGEDMPLRLTPVSPVLESESRVSLERHSPVTPGITAVSSNIVFDAHVEQTPLSSHEASSLIGGDNIIVPRGPPPEVPTERKSFASNASNTDLRLRLEQAASPTQCGDRYPAHHSPVSHSGPRSLRDNPVCHPTDSYLHADLKKSPDERNKASVKRRSRLTSHQNSFMDSFVAQETSQHQSVFSSPFDNEEAVFLTKDRKERIVQLMDRNEWIVALSFTSTAIEVLVDMDIRSARQHVIDQLELDDVAENVHILQVNDVEYEKMSDVGTVITATHNGTIRCSVGFFVTYKGMLHCVSAFHGSLNPCDQVSGGHIHGTCRATAYTSTCDATLIQIDTPHLQGQNILKDITEQEYTLDVFKGEKASLEQRPCSKFEPNFRKDTGRVTSVEFFLRDKGKDIRVQNCIAIESSLGSKTPFCVKGDSGKVAVITWPGDTYALGIGVICAVFRGKVTKETGEKEQYARTILTPMHRVLRALEQSQYCQGEALHLKPRKIHAPPMSRAQNELQ